VIDCADPDRLARFWKEALHYEFTTTSGRWASLRRTLISARTGSVTRKAVAPASGSRRSMTSRP
jgi:Glyoxalase-like domain